jgi:hypothetical protein
MRIWAKTRLEQLVYLPLSPEHRLTDTKSKSRTLVTQGPCLCNLIVSHGAVELYCIGCRQDTSSKIKHVRIFHSGVSATVDHKPSDDGERERIIRAGGFVTPGAPARLDGVLSLSRAFGDFTYKKVSSQSSVVVLIL